MKYLAQSQHFSNAQLMLLCGGFHFRFLVLHKDLLDSRSVLSNSTKGLDSGLWNALLLCQILPSLWMQLLLPGSYRLVKIHYSPDTRPLFASMSSSPLI